MLYTVMPMEVVLGIGTDGGDGLADAPVVAELNGLGVLCRPLPNGGARLERLLSTDPADFLRPELSPGEVVYGVHMKAPY